MCGVWCGDSSGTHASQLGMVQLGGERGGKDDLRADISNTHSVQALPMKFKTEKSFKNEDFQEIFCALSEVNIIENRYFASKWPDPNICCKK